jgi:zinc transporter
VDVAPPLPILAGIPGLVWAYQFEADGSARALHTPVDTALPGSARSGGGWLWLHFSLSDARACEFISQMNLPARAKTTLLARDVHPNLHLEGDTAFGAFVDWHYETANVSAPHVHDTISLGRLCFALSEGLIVSARLHPLRSVESIRRRIDEGAKIDSAGRVLEAIVEEFASAVARAHTEMTATLDGIEDRVLAESLSDERRDLGVLRRNAVRLHRPLRALQRVLEQFDQRHRDHSSHALLAAAARLSQRIDHLDAEVISIERRARLLHDEVATKLTEQTNRQLYVLSILTALFLPPTLVVGVFGMNTGGLPLTQNPVGTAIAIGLGVLASLIVWRVLRRVGAAS